MNAGESWVVLGKNGSGKTTLIHTLAGLRSADNGEIFLRDKLLHDYSRQHISQQVGVLFQSDEETFPSTVLESTLIGRHPYLGWMQWESATDIELAEQALNKMRLLEFKSRDIHTLSGGERRRTRIACLLTQNPDIALLDEPSNHLDIQHQIETLTILKKQFQNKLLFLSAHDINLANRFCTHALLLLGDGKYISGEINEVITTQNLETLYGIRINKINQHDQDFFFPA
ncbi:MAG: ABC transporter ATP-binding protein [Gammaproteobacteria bacterium]|nr:ABC transporter ATP-binding protein [Gammaproteobacteria bacterium]